MRFCSRFVERETTTELRVLKIFIHQDGIITGAKITEYLLEKSRIVTHAPEERNYHVFYEMLAGLTEDQRQKFGLMSAEKYFYLNQGGSCIIDGKSDKDDYQNLLSAMQVRFSNNVINLCFKKYGYNYFLQKFLEIWN